MPLLSDMGVAIPALALKAPTLQPTTQILEPLLVGSLPRLVPAVVWEIDRTIAMGFSVKSLGAYDPLCLSAHENNKLGRQKINFAAQKVPVVFHLRGSFSVDDICVLRYFDGHSKPAHDIKVRGRPERAESDSIGRKLSTGQRQDSTVVLRRVCSLREPRKTNMNVA